MALEEALRVADVDGARAEQQRRREAGDARLLGIGVSTYVEITGFGGSEFGSVRDQRRTGSATVMSGTSAHGQGHATSFAMIVADRLGIPMDRITLRPVRHRRRPQRRRHRRLPVAPARRQRGLRRGRDVHEQAVRDRGAGARGRRGRRRGRATTDGGGLGVAGVPDVRLSWADLAGVRRTSATARCARTSTSPQKGATFPFGAHVSIVEVDTETGQVTPLRHVAVDDCGRILNPLIVDRPAARRRRPGHVAGALGGVRVRRGRASR